MQKHQLHEWLLLTANIAVVAGILFLAVEIQQKHELLRAEARYHMLTNITDQVTNSYTNETVMSGWLKVEAGEEITAEERFSLLRHNHTTLRKFEWEYQQYCEGLIDEADIPIRGWIEMFSTQPLMNESWEYFSPRYSENFRLFMEENVLGQ
jgi:hypothetical protein